MPNRKRALSLSKISMKTNFRAETKLFIFVVNIDTHFCDPQLIAQSPISNLAQVRMVPLVSCIIYSTSEWIQSQKKLLRIEIKRTLDVKTTGDQDQEKKMTIFLLLKSGKDQKNIHRLKKYEKKLSLQSHLCYVVLLLSQSDDKLKKIHKAL